LAILAQEAARRHRKRRRGTARSPLLAPLTVFAAVVVVAALYVAYVLWPR
jgi:hypothetical protein